ncbi:RluA family pseudouridine synthase [Bacillus sp. FJAT-42376]|uniref:RluA family pseudouridine synthase n=1 Tax=Bacillus sp. FJAT-42376 TaxID=2014076 RepID=UPI000F500FAF|nr:RluA family pseudouridine synthase [Bacillus sp. FJAT-42376]AZB42003.1 RluA family pseudouridine synthase [Bacillus sp. FJAT-42376]
MKRRGSWLEFPVGETGPVHINDFLLQQVGASKGVIAHYRKTEGLMLNGSLLHEENPRVEKGDTVSLEVFKPEKEEIIPEFRELDILFEDEHLIALNKPAGMKTHPNEAKETGTLANALAFYYMMQGEERAVRHVHRLDEDTSGAILFAKHALAQSVMDRALQEHEISRTYIAAVHGQPKPKKGTIDKPIGRDRHHSSRRRVSAGGQSAVTHYELLKSSGSESVLRIQLETGRTHQIRVHLSHIGHPIIGDKLYGKPSGMIDRQALHAARIRFRHPLTNEEMHLCAPFPEDMIRWETKESHG